MIRRGKSQGWLNLPTSQLGNWASINNVQIKNVEFGPIPGIESRGSAIKASETVAPPQEKALIVVPHELVLSQERVHLCAKSDRHLREVLEAVGEFGRTTRGAVLIFLLVQATHNCPDITEKIGASSAFTDYIKFLPLEVLPTFWSDEELKLLSGTSLAPALEAKVSSLYREYDLLRQRTANVPWCQKVWWDEIDGLPEFDDWKQVDAMYRSRALEFPGIGDAMVPCIDMANHASGNKTAARYECDKNGNALLLTKNGQGLSMAEEVTITYGDEKGACEMLFSYGFLEDDVETARDILLSLDIPEDDPLRIAKKAAAIDAPGVRLIDGENGLRWEGDYVWIICVNEEDGLAMELAQAVDGSRELQASWKGQGLSTTNKLKYMLASDELWEVFQLRAVSVLQDRVETQLRALMESEPTQNERTEAQSTQPSRAHVLAIKLRELESELLERFYEFFESEKLRLVATDIVREYLYRQGVDSSAEPYEEDFS